MRMTLFLEVKQAIYFCWGRGDKWSLSRVSTGLSFLSRFPNSDGVSKGTPSGTEVLSNLGQNLLTASHKCSLGNQGRNMVVVEKYVTFLLIVV